MGRLITSLVAEDRNGNVIGATDTLGRPMVSWSGFGPSRTTNTVIDGLNCGPGRDALCL